MNLIFSILFLIIRFLSLRFAYLMTLLNLVNATLLTNRILEFQLFSFSLTMISLCYLPFMSICGIVMISLMPIGAWIILFCLFVPSLSEHYDLILPTLIFITEIIINLAQAHRLLLLWDLLWAHTGRTLHEDLSQSSYCSQLPLIYSLTGYSSLSLYSYELSLYLFAVAYVIALTFLQKRLYWDFESLL